MKTLRDVMTKDVVWVSPSARVKTAVILMKQNRIGALPVVDAGSQVVGLITQESLLGEPEDTAIAEVMQTSFPTAPPETRIRDAAEEMIRAGAGHLVVMEEDRLVGIVSRTDIFPDLGRNFDPLTGLPWADAMREWAMEALKAHREIAVIFYDLDDYGVFNKKYGHVVGDSVIREVARAIREGTDPELEHVCRYAGDEFAVVSLRQADEARALAERLRDSIAKLEVKDLPVGVSATYGIAGGRRTRERDDVHYAATIDDLITRASKDCEAHKSRNLRKEPPAPAAEPQPAAAPEPATPAAPASAAPEATPSKEERPSPRLRIRSVSITTTDTQATASVSLLRGEREYVRESRGFSAGGRGVLRLVAEAAAGAASRSMEPDHAIIIDDVLLHDVGSEDEVVTVTITFITPRWTARQVGSAVVRRGDQFRATAAAVLAAANRLIESVPQAETEEYEDNQSVTS